MRRRGLVSLALYRRWRCGPRTQPDSYEAPVTARVVTEAEAAELLELAGDVPAAPLDAIYVQVEWREP